MQLEEEVYVAIKFVLKSENYISPLYKTTKSLHAVQYSRPNIQKGITCAGYDGASTPADIVCVFQNQGYTPVLCQKSTANQKIDEVVPLLSFFCFVF